MDWEYELQSIVYSVRSPGDVHVSRNRALQYIIQERRRMNTRYVKWLYQELPEWVSKGIINAQNVDLIKQYYGRVSEGGKKRTLVILCSVLGALLIGLGIASLVAHNWDQLSRPIRAVLSIAPLIIGITLMGLALFRKEASDGFREGASTFLALMIGTSIALISQTYNIAGDPRDFTLTWMLLVVPLVYLATVTLPGVIYVIGVTIWSLSYVRESVAIASWYWPLMAIVIPHFIHIIKQEKFAVRATLLSTFLAISTGLFLTVTLSTIFPAEWMIFFPLIFSVLYLLGSYEFGGVCVHWQQPFFRLGGIGIVIVSLVLTFHWPWRRTFGMLFYGNKDIFSAAVGYIILFLLLAAAVFLNYISVKQRRVNQIILGIAPIIAIIGYSVQPLAMILFNIYFFALSLERILSGIRLKHLRIVNSGLLLLAILIMVRFFDSAINFVLKGLVLIVIGVGFLVTNIILIRRKGGE